MALHMCAQVQIHLMIPFMKSTIFKRTIEKSTSDSCVASHVAMLDRLALLLLLDTQLPVSYSRMTASESAAMQPHKEAWVWIWSPLVHLCPPKQSSFKVPSSPLSAHDKSYPMCTCGTLGKMI